MALPETGFLRLHQIIGNEKRGIPALIPISRSRWYAGCKSGEFPSPVKIGKRAIGWKVEDIKGFIASVSNTAAAE